MATTDHVHTAESSDSGMGFFLGILLLIVVFFLFFYYGLPMIQNSGGAAAPQINVPRQFDVNVNQK